MLQTTHHLLSPKLFFFPLPQYFTLSPPLPNSLHRPLTTTLHPVSVHHRRTTTSTTETWFAQVPEEPSITLAEPLKEGGGPIELPSSLPSIFASSEAPTPIQTATSLLLTGAISVFLFRSLRRRAKRAKDLKFRSAGAKKSLKEEALESLKVMAPTPVDAKSPPSPVQALIGGLTAGVLALILYKFTITIESSLNRQTLSDNFSVRQITITIRTIINGLCYLATFVFGINSVGLLLYSGQLAISSFMADSTEGEAKNGNEVRVDSSNSSLENVDSFRINSTSEDQSSDKTQ